MRKNTFLTTSDVIKYLFKEHDSGGQEVCANTRKNTFLTTSDVKKYLFLELDSGGSEVCANASKHVYYHFRR